MSARIDEGFWRGKRVFLTGHTGFKGSWMSLLLHDLGAEVFGYSLGRGTKPALFKLLNIDEYITSTYGDIRDPIAFKKAFDEARPDIVIHMAAQPIVSAGYDDPTGTFETNVTGTVNLLDNCINLEADVPILVISSDKCYLNENEARDFKIGDPLGGHDPYSASKAGTEIVVGSYKSSYFDNETGPVLASARAGNVVGGGDWSANRLLPDAARAFSEGQPLVLRDPSATRPWQHVLEPLYGYMLLIQALANSRDISGPWNFGIGNDHNLEVGKIAQMFADAWGEGASVEVTTDPQTWKEAKTLGLDSELTKQALNWEPALDMQSTVSWTADWYREVYADMSTENVRSITRKQISDYLSIHSQRT